MHNDVEYKCEICEQISNNRDILYAHVIQSHFKKKYENPNPNAKYTCEMCNKDFATKWSIQSHMLKHTSELNESNNATLIRFIIEFHYNNFFRKI